MMHPAAKTAQKISRIYRLVADALRRPDPA
jgi:hypothetical protein